MSEVGTPAPEAPIEQDGAIPETFTPAEPVENPDPEPEAPAPAAEAAPAEAEKPKVKPWFQDRIDKLTREKHEERQRVVALEAKLAEFAPEQLERQAFDPANFDSLVKQEASRQIAAEKTKERGQGFLNAGVKDYGGDAFTEKCNMVAAMGAGDSPEFMQLITDPEIIPNGHKVVAALADNPEEAQRILSLEPIKMAAALTRFANAAPPKAPAALSSAPAPIKPVGGSAKASTPEDTDDIKTWLAKRNASARTTAGGQANRH